ncbi:hypothetical protein ACFW4X_24440 [Streptomyces smyrnaeus]|uniref:hypothetical protein n=1 Tax=Streptomyces smyrnaeus TaxID=1387713 RepID=UPI003690FD7F
MTGGKKSGGKQSRSAVRAWGRAWSGGEIAVGPLLWMWLLICLPLAWFFGHLINDVPVYSARVVAAGLDWSGERGTVTVNRSQRVVEGGGRGGSSTVTHCFGDFAPAAGGAPLKDIRVHVEGGCEAGRTVAARLIRAEPDNWLTGTDQDQAYAGDGWGKALFIVLFMGAFLLIVGGLPIFCAVLFPVMILKGLYDRARARIRGRTADG